MGLGLGSGWVGMRLDWADIGFGLGPVAIGVRLGVRLRLGCSCVGFRWGFGFGLGWGWIGDVLHCVGLGGVWCSSGVGFSTLVGLGRGRGGFGLGSGQIEVALGVGDGSWPVLPGCRSWGVVVLQAEPPHDLPLARS